VQVPESPLFYPKEFISSVAENFQFQISPKILRKIIPADGSHQGNFTILVDNVEYVATPDNMGATGCSHWYNNKIMFDINNSTGVGNFSYIPAMKKVVFVKWSNGSEEILF